MKSKIKRYVSYVATLAIVIVVSVWVAGKYGHFGRVEFTDNAQVRMQIVPVSSRVQGYIREIRFNEYEPVHKGDTLVIIDDSDYRLSLAQAEADLSQARAGRSVRKRSECGVGQCRCERGLDSRGESADGDGCHRP